MRSTLAFLALLLIANLWAAPPPSLEGWELVFEDQFTGNSLDLSKWNPTYNWGKTHNHRAFCVPENVLVEDGKLRIKGEAKRHPDAPPTASNGGETYSLDYTSGAIDTRNKFEVKYGYIEGRFKAPKHQGTWPAFWTLQDGWPPEIDILEIPHNRKEHHYYLHFTQPDWYDKHGQAWDHEASFGGVHSGPDKSAGFYNYGVDWYEGNLDFYFDDKRIASYHRPREVGQLNKQYLLVNLAIGGWAGNTIEVTANNPAYYEAEWVRVWQPKKTLPDIVRLQSVANDKCMLGQDKKIVMGDCLDKAAEVNLEALSGSIYRINFGEKVLEIPNESKDAGANTGLWDWNGKDHQRMELRIQKDFESTVVRIKMQHSGHYLRLAGDSAVIQDWDDAWSWNQNWKIIKDLAELENEDPVYMAK
ncbi:MAG: family 16 glycosylhydrolase [Fibrobacter sp.]|nr:family 16 glycosylhydrolase [Fibrobacter sp.]